MSKDKFRPTEISDLPWTVLKRDVWHSVKSSDGKTVCNCRNIKDAEFIVKIVNCFTIT